MSIRVVANCFNVVTIRVNCIGIGLLMSLNMLVETSGGFDYTGADCCGWMRDAGFQKTYIKPLVGPDSMVLGVK